jgi:hypothetical protein
LCTAVGKYPHLDELAALNRTTASSNNILIEKNTSGRLKLFHRADVFANDLFAFSFTSEQLSLLSKEPADFAGSFLPVTTSADTELATGDVATFVLAVTVVE